MQLSENFLLQFEALDVSGFSFVHVRWVFWVRITIEQDFVTVGGSAVIWAPNCAVQTFD